MEKESKNLLMEIFIKVSMLMVSHLAMESIIGLMEVISKVCLKMV